MPAVSVIMPCFNAVECIGASIESVLAQSFTDFELLIVDDRSEDGTFEFVREQYTDARVRTFRLEQNSGAGVARNRGIGEAFGDYIAFLDADDLWLPRKLELQIRFMLERSSVFSCGPYALKSNGRVVRLGVASIDYDDLLKSNWIGCLTVVYDRRKLGTVYMPVIRKRQDYACWLEILSRGYECDVLDECLSIYNDERAGISNNKLAMLYWNYEMFRTARGMGALKAAVLTLRNGFYRICKRHL